MENMPVGKGLVVFLLLGLFYGGRLALRWRRASIAAERIATERAATSAMHSMLIHHQAWYQLWRALHAGGISVAPPAHPNQNPATLLPAPAGSYVVGLLAFWTPTGPATSITDPNAKFLCAYLRGPKKIHATLELATGQVHVRDVVPFEWPDNAM